MDLFWGRGGRHKLMIKWGCALSEKGINFEQLKVAKFEKLYRESFRAKIKQDLKILNVIKKYMCHCLKMSNTSFISFA